MKFAICCKNKIAQARGLCKNHYDKWLKENNPTYKEAQSKNAREWAKIHKEELKIYHKEHIKTVPIKNRRNWSLMHKYGITDDQYEELFDKQGGKCALCFAVPKKHRFHVDHIHDTKIVRGILCHQCNWSLGKIDKDPNLLKRIETYLKENCKNV